MTTPIQPAQIIPAGKFLVVRDDFLVGGTKEAALMQCMPTWKEQEIVFASPRYGYAQIALAVAGKATGKKVTLFIAASKRWHPRSLLAQSLGANIVEVPCGYLCVVQARAREYCERTKAKLLPLGLACEEMEEAITRRAAALNVKPKEVWSVAGSGALQRALQKAWPAAKFFAVQIGKPPHAGSAKVLKAEEKFEQDAVLPPPFPSCSNYDAKAWALMLKKASRGALFWNVGA